MRRAHFVPAAAARSSQFAVVRNGARIQGAGVKGKANPLFFEFHQLDRRPAFGEGPDDLLN